MIYTKLDWVRDSMVKGVALRCPKCRKKGWFGPRWHVQGDSIRIYRACKFCGFWQEADGKSEPYECWMAEHYCSVDMPGKDDLFSYCPGCLQLIFTNGITSKANHWCWKWVPESVHFYTCQVCKSDIDDVYCRHPKPSEAKTRRQKKWWKKYQKMILGKQGGMNL